jgi:hypothetical protein
VLLDPDDSRYVRAAADEVRVGHQPGDCKDAAAQSGLRLLKTIRITLEQARASGVKARNAREWDSNFTPVKFCLWAIAMNISGAAA